MMKAFLLRRGIYLILGVGALFLLTFFQSSTIELVSRDFRGFNDLYKNISNATLTAGSNSQQVPGSLSDATSAKESAGQELTKRNKKQGTEQ